MKKAFILSMLITFLYGETVITVYNEGVAVVNDTKKLWIPADTGWVKITGVPEKIDASSVKIEIPDVKILEENYDYDLASMGKLLEKMRGRVIDLVMKSGTVLSGKLVHFDQSSIYLQQQSRLSVIRRDQIVQVNFESVPELATEPVLMLRTVSSSEGEKEARITYLTEGLSWNAEYIGILKGDSMDFSGWVSIDNRSGESFEDARIRLIAGKIKRAGRKEVYRGAVKATAAPEAAPPVTAGRTFEYHVYSLNFLTTLKNNEKKQVNFLKDTRVKFEKVFQYDGRGEDVQIILKFKNSSQTGPGVPLPEGTVRIFKELDDGSKEFLGEDKIPHTPVEKEVNLNVGVAFDIKAKRTVLKRFKLSEREREEDIKVVVTNFKDKPVTVHVVDHFYGFWEIVQSTHPPKLKDAYTVEFVVDVGPHDKTELVYRVRQTW